MTEQELNALLQLLQRTPLSQAEAQWLEGLVKRLAIQVRAGPMAQADKVAEETKG